MVQAIKIKLMKYLIPSILMFYIMLPTNLLASQYHFLSEIEDVEREAWWLISKNRLNSSTTPWRAIEKALNDAKKMKKKLPPISLCQKMQVSENEGELIITSHCLATPLELARLKQEGVAKWSIEISTPAFKEHFGLHTSIFSSTLKCSAEVTRGGQLQTLSCPVYARDLNQEEWVELINWSYSKSGKNMMKINGTIKKQFETVATLSTVVPRVGDITVKEVRVPQKPTAEEGSSNGAIPPSR